jgi:hypothetical protein
MSRVPLPVDFLGALDGNLNYALGSGLPLDVR